MGSILSAHHAHGIHCNSLLHHSDAYFPLYFFQCFITSFFLLGRSLFLNHFCSYSVHLVLSGYFFYVTFAIMIYPFQECSMCLYKRYQFETYISVIWKTFFIVLPLFTRVVLKTHNSKLFLANDIVLNITIVKTVDWKHIFTDHSFFFCE